ncbi:MAG: hypothetical protein U0W24_05915 [Bacteroidales bacterium]
MWGIPSIPIPEDFFSSKNNSPIGHCVMCGRSLLLDNAPYLIEKAYQRNLATKKFEVVFEYALCSGCQVNAKSELSTESLNRIKMYYNLYVDFDKRQEEFNKADNKSFSGLITNCIITKKPITEYNSYQIGGMCFRDRLLMGNLPFAVGEKAIDEIQELISKKTRDFLDRFKETVIPPGIKDKVPDDFLILI